MQQLRLANNLFRRFAFGKRAVICAGFYDIRLEALEFKSTKEEPTGGFLHEVVEVVEVRHKRVCDLTNEEAWEVGGTNIAGLLSTLGRLHPHLKLNDEITVVFFTL